VVVLFRNLLAVWAAGNVVRVTGSGLADDLTAGVVGYHDCIKLVHALCVKISPSPWGGVWRGDIGSLVFFWQTKFGRVMSRNSNSILAGVSSLSSTRSKGSRFRRIRRCPAFRCWFIQAIFANRYRAKISVATGYARESSL
jgi:hypothetical protein